MHWDLRLESCRPDEPVHHRPAAPDHPAALGSRSSLINRITSILPGCDFSNPARGFLVRSGYSFVFELGGDEICSSIRLHVNGGACAIAVIERLLTGLHLCAIDTNSGEVFTLDSGMAEISHSQHLAWQSKG